MLRAVLFALGMTTASVGVAAAQAASPAPVAGPVYAVVYVEVLPTARATAAQVLRAYRDATRKEDGNLRCEMVQRIGQLNQFVALSVWKDQKALEAHATRANSIEMHEKIAAIRIAPNDERVHVGLAVGLLHAQAPHDAVYVVTHVDVVPPRKDDGVAALRQLAEDSRSAEGNRRFEVLQQENRPNHFTVVEIWESGRAVESHSTTAPTRRFRDALAPLTGALYDERMYRALD